jgi:hypothetical protein
VEVAARRSAARAMIRFLEKMKNSLKTRAARCASHVIAGCEEKMFD